MELNKSILLLLVFSSLVSFLAEAKCVPRNTSNCASGPAAASGPDLAPLSSPVSSPSASGSELSSILSSASNNPVLTKICGVTDYPEECLASIGPFLTGLADPISVLKMEMQAMHKAFKDAIDAATKLSKDPSQPKWVKGAVDSCLDVYDSGLLDLNDALSAITAQDIGRLSTMLSSLVSYPDTCEESFAEFQDPGASPDSPLKALDEHLNVLASNNLAITTLLHWS